MNYREVKCSDRLPSIEGKQYHTNMGLIYYKNPKHAKLPHAVDWSWEYDGGGFFIDSKDVEYWLEPYELPTEEEIQKLEDEYANFFARPFVAKEDYRRGMMTIINLLKEER